MKVSGFLFRTIFENNLLEVLDRLPQNNNIANS